MAVLVVAEVVARLPAAIVRYLGTLVGTATWLCARRQREAAEQRTRDALRAPPADIRYLIRRCALAAGRNLFEAVRLLRMPRAELHRRITLHGLPHLEEALAKGRGAVIISAHVGNWELMAAAIADAGVPLHVVARRPDDPRLARRLEALRRRWGTRVIWRERGMRPVLRALRAGEAVGFLIDQATDVPGVTVPFFGKPAHTPVAPAKLVLRTGAPVVMAHAEERLGSHVAFIEPGPAIDTVSADEAERALSAAWTSEIERWVRRAPENWIWMHNRWRDICTRSARGTRVAAALAVAVLAAALPGCEKLSSEPDAPVDQMIPTQEISNTRIIWSEDGVTSALITANTLRRYEGSDEVHLEGDVRVELFEDDGRRIAVVDGERGIIDDRDRTARVDSGMTVRFLGSSEYGASTLTADSAWAEDITKRVTAIGNVSIVSDGCVTLTTQRLIWNGRSRRFHAPGHVRIATEEDVEEGENLRANADLSQWTMEHVRGRTRRAVDEAGERIRGDGAP